MFEFLSMVKTMYMYLKHVAMHDVCYIGSSTGLTFKTSNESLELLKIFSTSSCHSNGYHSRDKVVIGLRQT